MMDLLVLQKRVFFFKYSIKILVEPLDQKFHTTTVWLEIIGNWYFFF